MLIVIVDVFVKPGQRDAFCGATVKNAIESRKEPGIARFDLLEDRDNSQHFQLIEVYRDDQAPALHKETLHYQEWRDAVADMMERPRSSQKFTNLSPPDATFA